MITFGRIIKLEVFFLSECLLLVYNKPRVIMNLMHFEKNFDLLKREGCLC